MSKKIIHKIQTKETTWILSPSSSVAVSKTIQNTQRLIYYNCFNGHTYDKFPISLLTKHESKHTHFN